MGLSKRHAPTRLRRDTPSRTVTLKTMHTTNPDPGDGRLTALLRATRPAPALPPRFQENVWRRIEQGPQPLPVVNWLEWLASLVLQPRFALATVCALVVLGAAFYCGHALCERRVANPADNLDWLRLEFRLSDAELARIRLLHEGYL